MAKLRVGTLERLRRVEGSLESRALRVRKRLFAILQVAIAAGLAFWVAQTLVGHPLPFFAPITVVIILGLAGGERIRKALELSLGVIVGVGLGDLLVHYTPDGPWMIPLVVGVSLLVASFLSKSPLVSNQVAIGSILIATILPPGTEGGGPDRMLDAFVGAAIWRLAHDLGAPGVPDSPAVFVVVAMMACFGSVAHAPLAVMIMVAEMTGSFSVIPCAMVAVGIAYLLILRTDVSIYQAQRPDREAAAAQRGSE